MRSPTEPRLTDRPRLRIGHRPRRLLRAGAWGCTRRSSNSRAPRSACRARALARSCCAQHLAGVQDSARIERALDGPHELELDGGGIALELGNLQPADAVLGAEAAAEARNEIVDRAHDRIGASEEVRRLRARRLTDIEMQIAVPDVAVHDESPVGHVLAHPSRAALD